MEQPGSSQGHEAVATAMRKRCHPMVWNIEKDELLLKEILLFEPYQYKPRTKERGNAWKGIAENLNDIKSKKFKVDQRGVRERFNTIRANCEAKLRYELSASGIAPEITPVDEAMEDILDRIKESEKQQEEEDKEKSEKSEKEKLTAEDMRFQSLETFQETKKRKQRNGDADSEDDSPRGKKTRTSGSDTLMYLREKAERDVEIKKEELELKRKDQELQVTYQRNAQQQQQQMFQVFTDQVQQQQQQNNQMMMMMMQMMQNSKK